MTIDVRPSAAQRVLVGTAATLTSYKRDQYGEVANPGTTTVTVTRADDTVVATTAATTEATSNQLSYTLAAADNTQLDWMQAVWTDTDGSTWTTYHEVVGGFYATVAEVRERDPNLNDAGKYPAATIRALLEEIETAFEVECGRAFVPRFGQCRITGSEGNTIMLPDVDLRTIRAVSTNIGSYPTFTSTDLTYLEWFRSGAVKYTGWWSGDPTQYLFAYEYGMDRPPSDVKAAAIRWLRATLNSSRSAIPDRAASFSVANGGSYSLIVPGQNGAVSGIPEVDEVIARYRVRRFMVGV